MSGNLERANSSEPVSGGLMGELAVRFRSFLARITQGAGTDGDQSAPVERLRLVRSWDGGWEMRTPGVRTTRQMAMQGRIDRRTGA